MSSADKALAAVVKMTRIRDEVDGLTEQIAEALGGCPGVFAKDHVSDAGILALLDQPRETHLRIYYRHVAAAGAVFHLVEVKGAAEFRACPHCVSADKLIQQRKAARRRLGAARGTITRLAREHMKEAA